MSVMLTAFAPALPARRPTARATKARNIPELLYPRSGSADGGDGMILLIFCNWHLVGMTVAALFIGVAVGLAAAALYVAAGKVDRHMEDK